MIASESVPYAKVGGMADVVGSLSSELQKLGNQVVLILPKYSFIDLSELEVFSTIPMRVRMGDTEEWCSVHKSETSEKIPLYFIEFNNYFNRQGIYHDEYFNDYQDNARRYTFFSRAALELCGKISFSPDIIHVHDWQTAAVAAYLKTWHYNDKILKNAVCVLTIHNIGYQGIYSAEHFAYSGLGWNNFTSDKFEDYGRINLLKGGIHYADVVTTVSKKYVWETKYTEMGCGLSVYLLSKREDYIGILNGVDYSDWDPSKDSLIPHNYTKDNLRGKTLNKKALQKQMHLEINPDKPLVGIISRFVQQKGMDILASVIESIVTNMEVQFAVLGAGDKGLEHYYGSLPARYPGKIGSYIGYNNKLAHLIEAGTDFFLMPSRYEPCGLNQIYSLRYGSLPIVRATGGLDDTIEQYDEKTGSGTGFKFWEASPNAIYYTVGWAVSTYFDRKKHMKQLIKNAMNKDFSWEKSAKNYVKAYNQALIKKIPDHSKL